MSARLALRQGVIAASASGGGGFPVWLPQAPSGDHPLVYADFKNGHYWADGAETDAATLLQENTAWGSYDPVSIVPGSGLGSSLPDNNSAPVLNPALASVITLITSGATVVKLCDVPNLAGLYAYDCEFNQLPDFNTQYWSELFVSPLGGGTDNSILGAVNQTDNLTETLDVMTDPGIYGHAYTITTAQLDWAVNGVAETGITPTEVPTFPWNFICIQQAQQDASNPDNVGYMQSIALYAPQPTADLVALSTP